MHYLYILYSLKDHKLYKGTCADVVKRFVRHNSGGNKSTAHRKPFALIHVEAFNSKSDALKQEAFYKSLEGGSLLRALLIDKKVLNLKGLLNIE